MNHRFLSLFFITILSISSFSQSKKELKESAIRDAKITAKATLNSDFETVLKHTYPSIIKLMGGKEKAINLIKTTFENMKSNGFVFESADFINISEIVEEQNQIRCYIENKNVMKMPAMKIISKSFLLGVYNKENKIWYFLEAEKLKNKSISDLVLPNFKTSLNIPSDEVTTSKI